MQVGPFALDRLRHRPRTAPDVEDLASNRRQVRKQVAQLEAVHESRTRPQWSGAPALGLVIERRQRLHCLVLRQPHRGPPAHNRPRWVVARSIGGYPSWTTSTATTFRRPACGPCSDSRLVSSRTGRRTRWSADRQALRRNAPWYKPELASYPEPRSHRP